MILRRGDVVVLKSETVVVVLERSSPLGWNCAPLASKNPAYQPGGWDLFIFEEDLKNGEKVDMSQFLH